MNREIKFRFWLSHTKRMTHEHTLGEIPKIIPEFTSDIIPLQYTGLKDKNGKEIYEGDVLRSIPTMKLDKTIIISVVQFDEPRGMWVANAIKYDEKEYLFEAVKPHHETAIIGNIYENPELLNPLTRPSGRQKKEV